MASQLKNMRDAFAVIASFPEYRHSPIVIGESDPEGCAACREPRDNYRNGTMYSSYTAASFPRATELAEQYGVNLRGALTWAFEFEDQPPFAGFRALASDGLDLPVFNVFHLFAQMDGQRLPVASTAGFDASAILKAGVRGHPDVMAQAGLTRENSPSWCGIIMMTTFPARRQKWHWTLPAWRCRTARCRRDNFGLMPITATATRPGSGWENPQPSPAQYAQLEAAGKLAEVGQPASLRVSHGEASMQLELQRQAVVLLVLTWKP